MKILTLNTWGGRVRSEFFEFLQRQQHIDVLCFQEVYDNALGKETIYTDNINVDLHTDLKNAFPGHVATYVPCLEDWWGLTMLVKKGHEIFYKGSTIVHDAAGLTQAQQRTGLTPKALQYISVKLADGKIITVLNLHGLWNGKGKTDCDERLVQSKNIINCIKYLPGHMVLCGDLNLLPDTKSLKMIEEGLKMRNLVTEYGITSTRTPLYTKEGKYADYILVGPGLTVKEFNVLPDVVSDHAPLCVDVV